MDIKELQDEIAAFNEKNDMRMDPQNRLLDLSSELGELSKELLISTKYGRRDPVLQHKWKSEMGDCLYALISLANETDTDLASAIDEVKEKYQQRIDEKNHPGSN